jgi:superfamily II DNA or RNA helicase
VAEQAQINYVRNKLKMELNRSCQQKAYERTTELLETHDKCIVKMFCGTGKSRVIRTIILTQKKPLSIVVFPSLALIRQFTADYLKDIKTCAILNVSSEQLDDFQSTTEPADIRKFTVAKKDKKMKIVCVTYQSLQVLLDNLGDAKVGLACFDEAHRTTSPESVKLVYGDEYRDKYEKQVFFTATPVNANGITMFDRERDEMGSYGDCGPLASEYTYLQGLRDAILSLFELRVDLYTQDTLGNIYESIARTILTTGNTRVLTFHADTAKDSKSETSVLQFVDKAKFMDAFRSVCAKEFPDQVGKFTASNVTFTAITADTKNKDEILGAFETCTDDDIYIVSSCRTIGEGVDTKKANMCVFVDPKSSPKDIIQNIGRICRKIAGTDRQPATVLIPVCIGWEKYVAAGDDAEKQDSLIREQLNDRTNGDYNAIMNIVAALKQEDPELYELCLRYPSNFTESERKHAIEEQGFRVLDDEDPDADDDLEHNGLYPAEIDELVENGNRVEIHTSNADVPIVYRGFYHEEEEEEEKEEEEKEERPIQRFYEVEEENDDGEMETRYHRIVPQNGEDEDEDSNRRLNPPNPTNRPRMNIHTNDEIKLLWRMDNVKLGNQFGSGVLECQVERMDTVERWKENHVKMCLHIDDNGGAPSTVSKTPEEKRLGHWTSTQKHKYNPNGSEFSKHGMKTNPETWQIWRDTLADPRYMDALKRQTPEDPVQDWKNKHKNMCEFIDSKKKAPSQCAKDFAEKTLGKWVNSQKNNHSNSNGIMKNQEILKIWTETLIDPKYSEALKCQIPEDPVQDWKNKHKNMCKFIDSKKKAPSQTAKDVVEKRMGVWTSNQKKNHNPKGNTCSKCIMKTNPEVWKIWTDTLADPRYGGVLADPVQDWKNKHTQMCDYISKNVRLPRQKDHEEKTLRIWIDTQKKNHNPQGNTSSKCIMKTNPEVWKIWNDTLADPIYGGVLADPTQDWKNKHTQMCDYISKNIKLPTQTTKEPAEKILRQWADTQKKTYDPRGAEFSNQIIKTNPETWQIWTDTLADPKYHAALNVKTGRRANATAPSATSKKSHLMPKSAPESSSLECSTSETNPTSLKRIADSDYKLTGRAWATQKSCTTHEKLQSNPAEWHAYHAARDVSFQGYVDQSQLPRNRVIAHLGNKRKHRLRILDLGCGRNNIARHFADDKDHKFTIQGYDHVAEEGSQVRVGNIADLAAQEEDESADICVYSQSLMGTDWPNYLTEGHRMLRYNGEFIISEHIKMLDDVRAELGRLGCKVESVVEDASATDADASDADASENDKVPKWFVLVARKV